MHLIVILAFGLVFWQAETPLAWMVLGESDVTRTLAIVWGQPVVLAAASYLVGRRAEQLSRNDAVASHAPQHFYHRSMFCLRIATILGFAVSVLLTPWPHWFTLRDITPALQIVGDVLVLLPFCMTVVGVWLAAFPYERWARARALQFAYDRLIPQHRPWGLRVYLDFQLRHHLFVVAVPMNLLLFAANLTRGYERSLREWSGWAWAPEVLLGAAALGVFMVAPMLLVRVWRTAPLQDGLLRARLEALSRRIGLRCREILVWQSDGIVINAAMTGLFAPVRYVLLSDGLLATMTPDQIEAVFGHEAGHIRHRHMPYFLVFAGLGWLLVAAIMEFLARASMAGDAAWSLSSSSIQAVGVTTTVVFWGVGFGWLSRRFERQADCYGAWCVTPPHDQCRMPCSVHLSERPVAACDGRVCATAAAVLASALERVALLNGIAPNERSWRHSSIASRVRFLTGLAGDPYRAERFHRLIHRIKWGMIVTTLLGWAAGVYYLSVVPEPALTRLSFSLHQNGPVWPVKDETTGLW